MSKNHDSLKPLENGECFLLELGGHRTVAVRLPANVASEISGRDLLVSEGFIAKIKSKLGLMQQAESWVAVTSVDNPSLEHLDKFKALLVERLTNATGRPITKSNLAVSASVPVNGEDHGYDSSEEDESMGFHSARS